MNKPKSAELILGYSCNMNCLFCPGEESRRGKMFSYESLRISLIQIRKLGYNSITFSGGEPTLHCALPELIELASYLGFAVIKLQTNGLLLSNAQYLKRLVKLGVNSIGVTIPSCEARHYNYLMSYNNGFSLTDKALVNLSRLRKAVRLEADIVICRPVLKSLPKLLLYLATKGVSSINFKYPLMAGNMLKNQSLTCSSGEALESIQQAISALGKKRVCFSYYNFSKTGASGDVLVVEGNIQRVIHGKDC